MNGSLCICCSCDLDGLDLMVFSPLDGTYSG